VVVMSTIGDWKDDYTGADLNDPQGNVAIGTSAGTNLGNQGVRDVKQVIRTASLWKGWDPDGFTATRTDSETIQVTGENLINQATPGQGVTFTDGSVDKNAYISEATFAANTDLVLAEIRQVANSIANDIDTDADPIYLSPILPRAAISQLTASPNAYPDFPDMGPYDYQSQIVRFTTSAHGYAYLAVPINHIVGNPRFTMMVQVVDSNGDYTLAAGTTPQATLIDSISYRGTEAENQSVTITLAEAPDQGGASLGYWVDVVVGMYTNEGHFQRNLST
jgi:hypothetical protein